MLRRVMRVLRTREDGSPAAEMALVITVVFLLLGGALEFGIVMFQLMEVNNAVEAGAGYAIGESADCTAPVCGTSSCTPGSCPASYISAIKNVVQSATGLGGNVTIPSGTPIVQCGCSNAAGTAMTLSGSSCAKPCYSGGPAPGMYVTVQGQYNLVSNLIPFMPSNGQILPQTITLSSTVRVY